MGPLAQLEEQLTLNQQVQGSTPWRLTLATNSEHLCDPDPQNPPKDQLISDFQDDLQDDFQDDFPENHPLIRKDNKPGIDSEGMKLSDAMALYRVTAQTEGRSTKTVKAVLASVRYFRDFLGEDVEVDKVTSYDVRRFIASLQSKNEEIIPGRGL